MLKKTLIISLLFSLSSVISVRAQMLSDAPQTPDILNEAQNSSQNEAETEKKQEEISLQEFSKDGLTPDEEKKLMKRLEKKLQPRIVDGKVKINPIEMPKTTDGSKRGTAAFVPIPGKDGKIDPNEDTSLIFLYYSDFKMTRTYAAGVGCKLRFNVLSNLNQRLINLSVKLVWPEMTTNVSFNNVNPNIENHFSYALFGQGCYNMDKIPNIVVNRCRIKGMTQEDCAKKIRWLSKRN